MSTDELPDAVPSPVVVHLHEAVRARAVALASDALGAMAGSSADEVPSTLRPFARTPRVKLEQGEVLSWSNGKTSLYSLFTLISWVAG